MLNEVKSNLRSCIRIMCIIQYQIYIYFVSLSVVAALLVPVLQHDDASLMADGWRKLKK